MNQRPFELYRPVRVVGVSGVVERAIQSRVDGYERARVALGTAMADAKLD